MLFVQAFSPSTLKPERDVTFKTFAHELQVRMLKAEFEPVQAPMPFAAFGKHAEWKVFSCEEAHGALSCSDYVLKRAAEETKRAEDALKHYNVLFGVQRNKALAAAFRAAKRREEEEQEEEEEEEEEDSASEDSKSESSESEAEASDQEEAEESDSEAEAEKPEDSSSSSEDDEPEPVKKKTAPKKKA